MAATCSYYDTWKRPGRNAVRTTSILGPLGHRLSKHRARLISQSQNLSQCSALLGAVTEPVEREIVQSKSHSSRIRADGKPLKLSLDNLTSFKLDVCNNIWGIRSLFMPPKATLVGIGNINGMDLVRKPCSSKVRCKSAMSHGFLPVVKPQSYKIGKWQANLPLDILQSLNHLLILIPPSDKLQ